MVSLVPYDQVAALHRLLLFFQGDVSQGCSVRLYNLCLDSFGTLLLFY